jgi:hypothetical protein
MVTGTIRYFGSGMPRSIDVWSTQPGGDGPDIQRIGGRMFPTYTTRDPR